jgi:rhodanese-related sulfurtransferase
MVFTLKEHTMNARVELPPARMVCPTTTRRLLAEGACLVDVREHAEIERLAFDVPGLVVMPLSEFEQRFAELPRDRELVLACHAGARSLKATYFLLYQGFTQVSNMEGGIMKWATKGFPIQGAPARETNVAGGCCGTAAPASVQATEVAAASSCCGGREQAAQAGSCCRSSSADGASDRGCC